MGRVYLPNGPLRRYRLQDTPEPVRPRSFARANVALGALLWLGFTAALYWLSSADGWQARADDALSGKRIAEARPGSATMLGPMPVLLPAADPPPPPTTPEPAAVAAVEVSAEPATEASDAIEPEASSAEAADEELELREALPPLVLRGVPLRTVVRGARRGTPLDPVYVRTDDEGARAPEPPAPVAAPSASGVARSEPRAAPSASVVARSEPPSAPAARPVEFPPAPWDVPSPPERKPVAPPPRASAAARPPPVPREIAPRPAPPLEPEPTPAPAPKPPPAPIADARGLPSCEAARDRQRQEIDLSRPRGPARDGWQNRARERLADGSYFAHCGLGARSALTLCTAVEQGRVVGVTVTTEPRSQRVNRCVRNAVAGLRFTASPEIEIFTTYFAPVR